MQGQHEPPQLDCSESNNAFVAEMSDFISAEQQAESSNMQKINSKLKNQSLVASQSIQNADLHEEKKLELGAPPINARNLNVQSVMAETKGININAVADDSLSVPNLQKAFPNDQQISHMAPNV